MLIRKDLSDDFEVDEGVCPVCEGLLFVFGFMSFVGTAIYWVAS
jgi:hypothetical protein